MTDPKKKLEIVSHTWRSWGSEGAGKENLLRAKTAWKSHRGANTILQNKNKSKHHLKIYNEKKKKLFISPAHVQDIASASTKPNKIKEIFHAWTWMSSILNTIISNDIFSSLQLSCMRWHQIFHYSSYFPLFLIYYTYLNS